jgi:hypothetical protein
MKQRHHTNFDNFSLVRTLGVAVPRQHKLPERLPQHLKELLAKLDAHGAPEAVAAPKGPREANEPQPR